jgi:hypothetical protein
MATPAYCDGQCPNDDPYCGLYEAGAIWEPNEDDHGRFCKLQGTLFEEFITEKIRNRAEEMGFDITDQAALRTWCEVTRWR